VHNESEPIQNWRLVQTKARTYTEFTHSRLISVRHRNPEGVASASPGLPYSPTLGDSAASMRCQSVAATPTGLRPGMVTKHDEKLVVHHSNGGRRNPCRGRVSEIMSQGRRVWQPWTVWCNPGWIALERQPKPDPSAFPSRKSWPASDARL